MAKTTTLPAKRKTTDAAYSGNLTLSTKLSPDQGLNSYLSEIRKYPMLEKGEEFRLAKSWVETGDTAAAEKMVTSHLRLVAKIAMGYREMKAIDEGDLRPEHLKKIATDLNVSETEVINMNRRMSFGGDGSLNVTIGGEDGTAEWQDWLEDENDSQEDVLGESQEHDARMELLEAAMADLNEREQHIIRERRLSDSPKTLEDLAKIYKVSRERIRQIEARAFEKLQEAMLKAAEPAGLIEG